jgi:hypothetical protein
MAGDDAIRRAIRRVDVVQIDVNLGRAIVFWLGRYAELAEQRYGCRPENLTEVQQALAEECARGGDSRQRELEAAGVVDVLAFDGQAVIDTATAAELLGITPSGVTFKCREGQLAAVKRGRQWWPYMAAVQQEVLQRRERSA